MSSVRRQAKVVPHRWGHPYDTKSSTSCSKFRGKVVATQCQRRQLNLLRPVIHLRCLGPQTKQWHKSCSRDPPRV
ncbi:Protein of unknown function [Pyronema omphalodes CBS 100304]|uniref:Uncharacterized protein n=1 Tax=Pyronema omphalodes (strain CBS 100304) TaxID=1076935 RepID=U4LGW9_PYROM|nr:Protein of unknown function [Pyronema omphalodes CBS 100304]